jgi:hypothetical protein
MLNLSVVNQRNQRERMNDERAKRDAKRAEMRRSLLELIAHANRTLDANAAFIVARIVTESEYERDPWLAVRELTERGRSTVGPALASDAFYLSAADLFARYIREAMLVPTSRATS